MKRNQRIHPDGCSVDQPVPKLTMQEISGSGSLASTSSNLAAHNWSIGLLFNKPPSQNRSLFAFPQMTSGRYVGAAEVARAAVLISMLSSSSLAFLALSEIGLTDVAGR